MHTVLSFHCCSVCCTETSLGRIRPRQAKCSGPRSRKKLATNSN